MFQLLKPTILGNADSEILTYSIPTAGLQPLTVTVVGVGGITTTAVFGGPGTVTATSAPTSTSGTKPEVKKNNTGLIVGSVIGGVGVVALIAIALLLFLRWRKRRAPRVVAQEVQLQPQTQRFDAKPDSVNQKPQLHSESVAIIPPVTLANENVSGATESKEIQVQIVPVIETATGEMQGEGRLGPMAEIQGEEARRGAQPVELDGDWDWVAGRSRKEAPGTGVKGGLP